MTQQELQKRLNQPYSTENWKEVVQEVFPNVQLLNPVLTIPVDNPKVESFRQLGNVRLQDGKSLALFELKLKSNVNILRNRVELNNLVSQYIDQEQNHGVLSIFEQGGEDFRFTFSARATEFDETEADFITKKTDTKRFTYVLGKNESCKTPAQRLHDLSTKKDQANINTIQDAFSVEKLSKEFFAEYKTHYERMVNYLTESPSYMSAIFNGNEKSIRDFVKLTLGRLVFIQFLQKKRWIGVPGTDSGWDSGDPYFLKHSFQNFTTKETFYSNFLEPLFFETLNKDGRPNQLFSITGTKVPYLNGGLFEKGYENSHLINFPVVLFDELFEFFNRYNFTIDESDPKEQEVGIDPEMLGHIFENLLEDNKDKGAFYTPKEIVHYMCQESLLEYLKTFLEEKGKWPTSEAAQLILEEALSNFIKKKEGAGIIDYDRELAIALRDVKICDPAIGSGAFPMGLLNEIFHAVYILFQASPDVVGKEWGMNEWKPNVVKKNIIQNSIYGVDIEKGAVDIARLRFWLSLIVDEPEPEALPNLDYKIVVGNSLISKLGDTVIDIDWNLNEISHGLYGADLVQRKVDLLKKISEEQKEFFNPESDKKKLATEIRNLKIDLLINQLELMVKTKGIHVQPTGISRRLVEQTEVYLQTQSWKESIKKLQQVKSQIDKALNFFDWKLDFPEILNDTVNSQKGYDIVIGNPPYVQLQKNGGFLAKEFENQGYKTFERTGDIYSLFYEKGINLLKKKGLLTFITSNKWMRAGYGKSTRNFFIQFNPLKLLDLGSGIFESATVDTNILIIQNAEYKNQCLALDFSKSKTDRNFQNLNYIKFQNLTSDNWTIALDIEEKMKFKLELRSKKLKDLDIKINYGIKTGFNEAFIIDERKKEELIALDPNSVEIIKPLLRGRDIKRYKAQFAGFYLINSHNGVKEKNIPRIDVENTYPEIYKHLNKFKNQLINRQDKGDHWTNLRSCSYIQEFENEKIVYPNMTKYLPFIFDDKKYYSNQKCFILTSESINKKFLIGFLNSKISNRWIRENCPELQGGTRELSKIFFENIPVPTFSVKSQNLIAEIVDQILTMKESEQDSGYLEQQIDNLIYTFLNFTYDEVKIIDSEFNLSEEEYKTILID